MGHVGKGVEMGCRKELKAYMLPPRKPDMALRMLHLLMLAAVLTMAIRMLAGQQHNAIVGHEPMMVSQPAGSSADSEVHEHNTTSASAASTTSTSSSRNDGAQLLEQEAHSRKAALYEQTQKASLAVTNSWQDAADCDPLPWRALSHLAKVHSSLEGSMPSAAARPPAYLISSFMDTRGLLRGTGPEVAIIMAVHRWTSRKDWHCLFDMRSRAGQNSSSRHSYSRLVVPYVVTNNEAFFDYQAATGTCSVPADFDTVQLLKQHHLPQQPNSGQQELYVTVIDGRTAQQFGSNSSKAAAASPAGAATKFVDGRAWVHVEVIPPLQSTAAHANTQGSIAVCTPPLHTDAYAATLTEWAEFARLMGASKVLVYAFNPGPLIKPLIKYYQAIGFFEVREWIIPASILQDPRQLCKLPFFHDSSSRTEYDSPVCTFHQDNYNIAWWGQVLAVQDCVYRAMANSHRWAVITDFDEYIMPQKASTPNWPAMLQELSKLNTGSQPAAEYRFSGVRVCSGCTQQMKQQSHTRSTSSVSADVSHPILHRHIKTAGVSTYRTKRAVAAGASDRCMHPSVGFDHILWSAVTTMTSDHWKCIVDPLAVAQAAVHGTAQFSADSPAVGRVTAPTDIALKLHDRVHDIHAGATFATIMLPELLQQVQARVQADVQTGVASGATSNGISSQSLANTPRALLQPWPESAASILCDQCGISGVKGSGQAVLDYGMCNLYGHTLWQAVSNVLNDMQRAGVFHTWQNLTADAANVYGGHSFTVWSPPK